MELRVSAIGIHTSRPPSSFLYYCLSAKKLECYYSMKLKAENQNKQKQKNGQKKGECVVDFSSSRNLRKEKAAKIFIKKIRYTKK